MFARNTNNTLVCSLVCDANMWLASAAGRPLAYALDFYVSLC